LTGQADLTDDLPADNDLAVRYPARLHSSAIAGLDYEFLNTQVPPFTDLRVRQAITLAVDRPHLVDLYGGPLEAQSTCQALPPDFPGYQASCPYPATADLTRARHLVAMSGTAGMQITVWGIAEPTRHRVTAYFAALLNQLGYRTNIRELPRHPYFDAVQNPQSHAQIGQSIWIADYPEPFTFLSDLFSCSALNPRTTSNASGYCDPAFDRQIAQAHAAVLTDPSAARALWHQADQYLTSAAPFAAAINERYVSLASATLGNYQTSPMLGPLLDQMWVR
jgi:peptide/nickel transport system substrate-binding protein